MRRPRSEVNVEADSTSEYYLGSALISRLCATPSKISSGGSQRRRNSRPELCFWQSACSVERAPLVVIRDGAKAMQLFTDDEDRSGMPELSIVVPFFNEQENVRALYRRLSLVLPGTVADYELVFVN